MPLSGLRSHQNTLFVMDTHIEVDTSETPIHALFSEPQADWFSLADINTGKLDADISLITGTHEISRASGAAFRIAVCAGTQVQIKAEAARDPDMFYDTRLLRVSISIDPPLHILNPASAFRPANTGAGRLLNKLCDSLASAELSGLSVDEKGLLHLEGTFKSWRFGKEHPICDLVAARNLPELPVRLDDWIETLTELACEPESATQLASLSKLMRPAQWTAQIQTRPTRLGIHNDALDIITPKTPAQFFIQGHIGIDKKGQIDCVVPLGEIAHGNNTAQLTARFASTWDDAGHMKSSGDMDLQFYPYQLSSTLTVTEGHPIFLESGSARNVSHITAHFEADEAGNWEAQGNASASIINQITSALTIETDHTRITSDPVALGIACKLPFHYQQGSLTVSNGSAFLGFRSNELHVMQDGMKLNFNKSTDTTIAADEIMLNSEADEAQAKIRLDVNRHKKRS